MKVTVITITYNSVSYLDNCIKSVISQDYPNIEYIIIDGGLSDGTTDVIRKYSNKISNWISEPDCGIYDAINKGIKLATGDIIGILNSDDFFANNKVISEVVNSFNGFKNVEAIYADICFVDKADSKKIIRYYSSKFFRPWMFRFGFQPAHPTLYVKKNLFDKYGLYRTDLKISGDFELFLRFLTIKKIKYKYIPSTWVYMREGGLSTSGLKSIILMNNEIIKACKFNSVYTNKLLVYSKYLIKWQGFLFKNKK